MSLISVDEALARIFALAAPLDAETIPLWDAPRRVLAKPIVADRDQPPFPASAMDGYAVAGADATEGATLEVVGVAQAGARFEGRVGSGQAVRIFTGAPVPVGADRVVIQEDVHRDGDRITVQSGADGQNYIRPQANDFAAGRHDPQRNGDGARSDVLGRCHERGHFVRLPAPLGGGPWNGR